MSITRTVKTLNKDHVNGSDYGTEHKFSLLPSTLFQHCTSHGLLLNRGQCPRLQPPITRTHSNSCTPLVQENLYTRCKQPSDIHRLLKMTKWRRATVIPSQLTVGEKIARATSRAFFQTHTQQQIVNIGLMVLISLPPPPNLTLTGQGSRAECALQGRRTSKKVPVTHQGGEGTIFLVPSLPSILCLLCLATSP